MLPDPMRAIFRTAAILTVLFACTLFIANCGGGGGGGGGTGAQPSPTPTDPSPIIRVQENTVKSLVDTQRSAHGLPSLQESDSLRFIARSYSEDMRNRGYFGHTNPEGMGLGQRITRGGITYHVVAENIALITGYTDPLQEAITQWMSSPEHRDNILDAAGNNFVTTGIGIAVDSEGRYYITQVFLAP